MTVPSSHVTGDFPFLRKNTIRIGFVLMLITFGAIVTLSMQLQSHHSVHSDRSRSIDQSQAKKVIHSLLQQPGRPRVLPQVPSVKQPLMGTHRLIPQHRHREEDSQRFQEASSSPISAFEGREREPHNRQSSPISKDALRKPAQQKVYLADVIQPRSPYELKAGTVIPASLITGINSELPGIVIAKVRQSIYDTVSGQYLLIPQGATLIGHYDSRLSLGQQRIFIAWERLIFPNGKSIFLASQPAVDTTGSTGLSDRVNHHVFRLLSSAMLYSLFSRAGELNPDSTGDPSSSRRMITRSLTQQVSHLGTQAVSRTSSLQPTIDIRPGTSFNVLLSKDMTLDCGYYEGSQ